MAIIFQYDKRSNITYAYESHSYWDKEKKMTRAKRTLIGRLDAATGCIVPTDGRCRKDKITGPKTKDTDYKKLYDKLLKKYAALESLTKALKVELDSLKAQRS